ncbi:MAG TPA: hypothetical protein VIV11_41640 [Kofleriaceae bacterium]
MNKLYFALGISLLGCGTEPSGPETLPNLEVPDVPENGLQVITPIFENIQPGTDNEVCAWTDKIFEKETDVKMTVGYQTEPPGHHALLFYTLDKQPAGTQRICTDTDMASFRYLTGNGSNGEPNTAPGDLVFRVPAGAQLVVNSHYLNTSDEVVKGQSLINVHFADPGKQYIASGATVFLDTTLDVPQGVSSFKTSCIVDRQQKFWYMIPHMHRWGTKITVDLTRTTGEKENLFTTDWQEQYTFHPPESRFDPETPFLINVGDQVDVNCTWNNDEGRSLPFGFEMCVAFGQTVDVEGRGSWACNGGQWHTF